MEKSKHTKSQRERDTHNDEVNVVLVLYQLFFCSQTDPIRGLHATYKQHLLDSIVDELFSYLPSQLAVRCLNKNQHFRVNAKPRL